MKAHYVVEFEDYFQGFGTHGTEYQKVSVGIGRSVAEALDDALNMLAEDCPEWEEKIKGLDLSEAQADTEEIATESGEWVYFGLWY